MKSYVIRRLLLIIPVGLMVGMIAFALIQLSPGDPATFFVSPDAPPEQLEMVRARLGLDAHIVVRFGHWISGVLRGNLGISFHQRRPVTEVFASAYPHTLTLAVGGIGIAILIALPVGIISAIKHNTKTDDFLRVFILIGISFPNFWLAMLLILLFAVSLGWLPSYGMVNFFEQPIQAIRHAILPWISLGYFNAALMARMTRSSMLDVLQQDYITTARSKGIAERTVIFKHALKNAFTPILTVMGLVAMRLLVGSVVIEHVYNVPGIGRLMVNSVSRRDYPVVQGLLLITAMMIVFINLGVDLLYALIDPRIKYN